MARTTARGTRKPFDRHWPIGVMAGCVALILVHGTMLLSAAPASVAAARFDSLFDQRGEPYHDQPGEHRYKLVVFGYTRCADICPASPIRVREILDALGNESTFIKPLFVTLDPQRDTFPVLSQSVAALDARILGIRGSPEAVDALAKSYGITPAPQSGTVRSGIDHSPMIYLPGRDDEILAVYSPAGRVPAIVADLLRQIGRARARAGGGAPA